MGSLLKCSPFIFFPLLYFDIKSTCFLLIDDQKFCILVFMLQDLTFYLISVFFRLELHGEELTALDFANNFLLDKKYPLWRLQTAST